MIPWFRVFPQYCLGEAFLNMPQTYAKNELLGTDTRILSWNITGRSICLLLLESAAYLLATLLVEVNLFSRVARRVAADRAALERRGGVMCSAVSPSTSLGRR